MVRFARAERRAHDDGSCELRWVQALSINVRSSRGVRSDIDRRCRGDCFVEVDWNRRPMGNGPKERTDRRRHGDGNGYGSTRVVACDAPSSCCISTGS